MRKKARVTPYISFSPLFTATQTHVLQVLIFILPPGIPLQTHYEKMMSYVVPVNCNEHHSHNFLWEIAPDSYGALRT